MSPSHTSRTAAAVVTLLLSVLVTGCEEDDPPNSPPSSSSPSVPASSTPSDPTTTVTTGPVEPTLPAAAEAETKAGAEAFVEYYWEVVNYAQSTGDTDLLRSLSIAACAGCNGGAEAIERIYRRGGRIDGGLTRVINTELVPKPSGGWTASQTVHVDRQRIVGAGDLDQTSRAGRLDLVLGVSFQSDAWLVTSLDV